MQSQPVGFPLAFVIKPHYREGIKSSRLSVRCAADDSLIIRGSLSATDLFSMLRGPPTALRRIRLYRREERTLENKRRALRGHNNRYYDGREIIVLRIIPLASFPPEGMKFPLGIKKLCRRMRVRTHRPFEISR